MQCWLLFSVAFFIFIIFFWKRFSYFIGFFDGLFLAFMCFCFLPVALEGEYFWTNSILLVLGVLGGSLLEQKTNNFYYNTKRYALLHGIVFFTAVLCLQCINIEQNMLSFLLSLLSGLFLLIACGGILPEEYNGKQKMKLAILGVTGFLIGILLIFPIA
ncbi:hypothetical protein [Clostridium sp. MD294]|uniref:hypothetical protein n=1 Tax=Clostridium sp. MD294 TaxID=97138 RepID=UPI0002CA5A74|nr:hypothetical protein [Clostridium sp. MD294]NDO46645.1 hypothetical protein [Clostridium sp. MD294]USF28922.1 hypothetical protein C820_000302 [Clostridium sp. MD294]